MNQHLQKNHPYNFNINNIYIIYRNINFDSRLYEISKLKVSPHNAFLLNGLRYTNSKYTIYINVVFEITYNFKNYKNCIIKE